MAAGAEPKRQQNIWLGIQAPILLLPEDCTHEI